MWGTNTEARQCDVVISTLYFSSLQRLSSLSTRLTILHRFCPLRDDAKACPLPCPTHTLITVNWYVFISGIALPQILN